MLTGRSLDAPAEGFGEVGGALREAADAVTALGGVGVPVRCDAGDDADVEALVNNAWGVPYEVGAEVAGARVPPPAFRLPKGGEFELAATAPAAARVRQRQQGRAPASC